MSAAESEHEFILYGFPFRSRAERVLWALEELGFPYKMRVVNAMAGETRSPEFLAINPSGKVPVLIHNGKPITESVAIMQYLNRLHPDQPLTPKTLDELTRFDQALSYGMTEIEGYLWLAEQNGRLSMVYKWPDGTRAEALKRVKRALRLVAEWVQDRPYIAGEAFSLADIYYYHLITWAIQQPDLEIPEPVVAYAKRLNDRPTMPKPMRQEV